MEIKLSIIVPIYNVENLLSKCLDSILNQTFKYFELILVNDGSTDKSGEICDSYAAKDQRIKTIHKGNGGSSSARNAGLEQVKGEYIGFVDSDDYIHPNMYEMLYSTVIKHDSDIVVCDYKEVFDAKSDLDGSTVKECDLHHFNNVEALNLMYSGKSKYIASVVPWNKIYKRELFDNIMYKIGNVYDDETVAHKLLYNSKKITTMNVMLYYYNQREGSQMNSSFHIKRFDKIYVLKDRATYFKNKHELEIYEKALKHYMDMFFWYYYLAKSNLKNVDQDLKKLKRTFDDSLFHLLKLDKISWKQKIMCLLFSLNPYLFERIRDIKMNKRKTLH